MPTLFLLFSLACAPSLSCISSAQCGSRQCQFGRWPFSWCKVPADDTGGQCDQKIVDAVRDGVNVIIWFSINLVRDKETGNPVITGPATGKVYLDCVGKVGRRLGVCMSLPFLLFVTVLNSFGCSKHHLI